MAYCEKYTTPKENFLSYTYWDRQNIMKHIAGSAIPVHVIMGEKDKRSSDQWLKELSDNGAIISIIREANHFFDQEEFEFFEEQ